MSEIEMDTQASAETYVRFGFSLDEGVSPRAAIGLVVCATDHTIEYEWRKLLKVDGVGFYESRIANSAEVSPETLRAMDGLITPSVELIRPGERLDVVAFGCTSASMLLGEERIIEQIKEARPEAACTTPITAVRIGLNALKAQRIGMLTPYVREINESMRKYLAGRGIDVVRMGSFEHPDDNEVARIDAKSVKEAILAIGRHDDVEAVFVSCTSLRIVDSVTDIERELGKPVLSSNHAMAWHALRLAGVKDSMPQFGTLYTVSP